MKQFFFLILLVSLTFSVAPTASGNITKTVQEAYELYSIGNYGEAADMFEAAYNTTAKNGKNDILGLFKLSVYAGLCYKNIEDYPKASLWFDTALEIAGKMRDKAIAAPILAYMAESERLAGDYDKSITTYLKAISNEFITSRDKAVLYFGLAESYRLQGDYPKAGSACDMASTLSGDFSIEQLKLSCDIIKGEASRKNGDYASALQYFGLVLDLARARQYHDLTISALNGLGLTAEALDKIDSARQNFDEALSLSLKNEIYDNVEAVTEKLAELVPVGDTTKNVSEIMVFLENNEISDSYVKISLWRLVSAYYKASSDYLNAITAAQNAYSEAISASANAEATTALYDIAYLMFIQNKYYSAMVKLDEAITKGISIGYQSMAKLYALKSECFLAAEKIDEALILMKEAVKYDKKYSQRLTKIENMLARKNNELNGATSDNTTITPNSTPTTNDGIKEIEKTDETPVG